MRWATIGKIIVAVVATGLCVAALRRFGDLGAVSNLLRSGDPVYVVLGTAITCVTILLRGVRMSLAVGSSVRGQLLAVSAIHNAMTALLPMKLGEFALPILLNRVVRMRATEGIGVLLLLRVLDLFALGLVGSLAFYLAFRGRDAASASAALAVFVVLCLAGCAGFAVPRSTVQPAPTTQGCLRIVLVRRLMAPALQLDRKRLATLGGCSVLIWLSLFSAFYCATRSIHPPERMVDVAAAGVAASLAFAFPISGVANVGPFQLAWVWMSTLLGMAVPQALTASLLAHGMVVAVTLTLGVMAFASLAPSLYGSHAADNSPPPTRGSSGHP